MTFNTEIQKIVLILQRAEQMSTQDELRKACGTSNYHARPLLHKLQRAGFLERMDQVKLRGNPMFWKVTNAGITFRQILEIYVKA